jgi:hypothetical protein
MLIIYDLKNYLERSDENRKYLRELERICVLKAIPRGNQILFLNISLYDLLQQNSN